MRWITEILNAAKRQADALPPSVQMAALRSGTATTAPAIAAVRPRLVPAGSLNRITEPDGHVSCNHSDAHVCARGGHETVVLYEIVPSDTAPTASCQRPGCIKPAGHEGPHDMGNWIP